MVARLGHYTLSRHCEFLNRSQDRLDSFCRPTKWVPAVERDSSQILESCRLRNVPFERTRCKRAVNSRAEEWWRRTRQHKFSIQPRHTRAERRTQSQIPWFCCQVKKPNLKRNTNAANLHAKGLFPLRLRLTIKFSVREWALRGFKKINNGINGHRSRRSNIERPSYKCTIAVMPEG